MLARLPSSPRSRGGLSLNPATRDQTLMLQLVLRTLGDVRTNVGL